MTPLEHAMHLLKAIGFSAIPGACDGKRGLFVKRGGPEGFLIFDEGMAPNEVARRVGEYVTRIHECEMCFIRDFVPGEEAGG